MKRAARLSLLPQWFGDPVSLSSVYTSVCVVPVFGVFVIFFNCPKSHREDAVFRKMVCDPVGVLPRGIPQQSDCRWVVFRAGSNPGG